MRTGAVLTWTEVSRVDRHGHFDVQQLRDEVSTT